MTTPLDRALKRLAELQREIAEVRSFIELYHRFESDASPAAAASKAPESETQLIGNELDENSILPVENAKRAPRRNRPEGATPKEIAELMERVIREADRPLSRGEIVEAIERREVQLPAADKNRYVGTIAWRNKGTFLNIDGRGYWLRNEPVPPGRPMGFSRLNIPENQGEDSESDHY